MTTAFYRTGTVAVTQNSKVVTGTGTNWTTGPTKPLAGDVFIFNNKMYEIDSVVSDTEIRLYRNFEDSTASSKSYAIMRNASLNISARIAAQVAQVVNQKQIMIDEFHDFLTNNTDSTVPLTDTLGNTINVTPIPMLDKDYVEKIGGIDAAVNQAIQDINDKFDSYEYILMREAEARAIQWQNENVNFDASGFVHMGKHYNPSILDNVNEGVFTTNSSNKFSMGRSTNEAHGESKTDFSVVNIAGAVSNVLTKSSYHRFQFELPEAEDGTRIYDSTGDARGSGKASLDLKVDVDPKYGDVPTGTEYEILREAVSRAFEGECRNGDFRLGDNGGWGQSGAGEAVITTLGATITNASSDSFLFNKALTSSLGEAVTYNCVLVCEAVNGTLHVDGNAGSGPYALTTTEAGTFTFQVATTATNTQVYIRFEAGSSATIKSFSLTPVTEEVVTHPVDLVGLEYYEEELTGRQEVFECIQSLSTTFGTTSVPTVLSTRKLSYFQQYDGQFPEVTADPDYINDRYRCVVWDDLTEPQKREVAAYMGEKLFVGVNGHIVNGRLRARTIRGSGNGDWVNIDSNALITGTAGGLAFKSAAGNYIKPHGAFDSVDEYFVGAVYLPTATTEETYTETSKGVYTARATTVNNGCAYKGRCFFYVVATVPRANKGAYHPSLNPWGCARFGKDATNPNFQYRWHSTLFNVNTTQDCWKYRSTFKNTGSVAVGYSGHPDGIFYDGIEAGGLNGVIDWRLPAVANDSPEEAAKVEAKVENGTYRGLEKLVKTQVAMSTSTDLGTNYIAFGNSNPFDFLPTPNDGELDVPELDCIVRSATRTVYAKAVFKAADTEFFLRVFLDKGYTLGADATDFLNQPLVVTANTNLSVSGEFNTQMVIGDPANILQTDALKDGWLGTWCPVIPDGANDYPFSRKVLVSPVSATYSDDLGVSWASNNSTVDLVSNVFSGSNPTGNVVIYNYKAFARQTKPSTNKPVYSAKAGLMDVFSTKTALTSRGCLFAESLMGKVLTDATDPTHFNMTMLATSLNPSGAIDRGGNYPQKHAPIMLTAPQNNSPAVKVLPYQISNNGQGSIGYQANELTWKAPVVSEETATTTTVVKGSLYRPVTGSGATSLMYVTVQATDDGDINWANYSLIDGKIYPNSGLAKPTTSMVVWSGSGWGDDSAIKVTADGSDTFVDLNGNTNLSVVHELAIPYTWTSNHARAGEQVEGVDL